MTLREPDTLDAIEPWSDPTTQEEIAEWSLGEAIRVEIMRIRAARERKWGWGSPNQTETDEQRAALNRALAPWGWRVSRLPHWHGSYLI